MAIIAAAGPGQRCESTSGLDWAASARLHVLNSSMPRDTVTGSETARRGPELFPALRDRDGMDAIKAFPGRPGDNPL